MPHQGYKRNHYVPQWYQKRFIPDDGREKKFFYLDMRPERISNLTKNRANILRWGPKKCFVEDDLYTVRLGSWKNVDIEKFFFGRIDHEGEKAVKYFANFTHPNVNREAFNAFMNFMSVQKLRTPKGLGFLSQVNNLRDKNQTLIIIQQIQNLYCAIWTECVWQIADAKNSKTKFIISDHPVTVYNRDCFPSSNQCKGYNDPDIRCVATQTIFPLSLDKIIFLTNLSWVRNPYQSELEIRPNSELFRPAVFNFLQIQTHRNLLEPEVQQINFIIKRRALRYIAAAEKDWLYPENSLPNQNWRGLGDGYLLMPDPRALNMGGEIYISYESGRSEAFSEYGHQPWQPGFRDENRSATESNTLDAFKGEFARLYGPKRRGRSFDFGSSLDPIEDSKDAHERYLKYDRDFRAKNK